MLKIDLFVHDIKLGVLTEIDRGYVFSADEKNIKLANKTYPIEMRRFKLNTKDNGLYKVVPPIFDEFLLSAERQDLAQKAGIDVYDSDLEIIYKLAGLDFHDLVFDIRQG